MKISETQWSWWFLSSVILFVSSLLFGMIIYIEESDFYYWFIPTIVLLINAISSMIYGIKEINNQP